MNDQEAAVEEREDLHHVAIGERLGGKCAARDGRSPLRYASLNRRLSAPFQGMRSPRGEPGACAAERAPGNAQSPQDDRVPRGAEEHRAPWRIQEYPDVPLDSRSRSRPPLVRVAELAQLGLLPIGRDPDSGPWGFAHLQSGEPAERGADGRLVLNDNTGHPARAGSAVRWAGCASGTLCPWLGGAVRRPGVARDGTRSSPLRSRRQGLHRLLGRRVRRAARARDPGRARGPRPDRAPQGTRADARGARLRRVRPHLYGERDPPLERAKALVRELRADRATLRRRTGAALDELEAHPAVDARRLAAIGFCFGGTAVLELARGGADVACVVGFHAGLDASASGEATAIRAKVLVCMGEKDPVITAPQRDAFVAEMAAAGVDWQMVLYGGVGHSFTNRFIDAWGFPGFAYDAVADRRSWAAMRAFLDETLGPVAAVGAPQASSPGR